MSGNNLLRRIVGCPRLPSVPAVAARVLDVCECETCDERLLIETLIADPASTAKILKAANRSIVSTDRPADCIRHAVRALGLNSAKAVLLDFTFLNESENAVHRPDLNLIAQHSLCCAMTAEVIAEELGVSSSGDAFMGALLQDVGMLAMAHTAGSDYACLIDDNLGHEQFLEREQRHLSIDHAAVGAALAENWKLPASIVDQIRFHERPLQAPPALRPSIHAAMLGICTRRIILNDDAQARTQFLEQLHRWFGVDGRRAADLSRRVEEEARRLLCVYEGDKAGQSVDAILSRANEVLARLCLRAQVAVQDLAHQHERLQTEAARDVLTGLANRFRLEEFLAEEFAKASRDSEPLAVLFCDADQLKAANDRYGHDAGDRLLSELARILLWHVPKGGLTARYGGDEFVMVLPRHDCHRAMQVAENARQAARLLKIPMDDGHVLQASFAVGVAIHDATSGFKDPWQLLAAADEAVYRAKAVGGNAVKTLGSGAAIQQETHPMAA